MQKMVSQESAASAGITDELMVEESDYYWLIPTVDINLVYPAEIFWRPDGLKSLEPSKIVPD